MWAADTASTYGTFVGYHPVCRTCLFNYDAMYVINTKKHYNFGTGNNIDGTLTTLNTANIVSPTVPHSYIIIQNTMYSINNPKKIEGTNDKFILAKYDRSRNHLIIAQTLTSNPWVTSIETQKDCSAVEYSVTHNTTIDFSVGNKLQPFTETTAWASNVVMHDWAQLSSFF